MSRAYTAEKIAVVAPMPIAKVSTAVSAKPGTAPQPAQPISDVLKEGVEYWQTSLIAIRLFGGFHSAQLDECLPPRFPGTHSGAQVVGDVHLKIAFDLLRQFAVAPILSEHAANAANETVQISHADLLVTQALCRETGTSP